MKDEFSFTVTDLARFLGKSAVTIRSWDKKGLIYIPRDSGGDRRLNAEDVRETAKTARHLGRINEHRLHLVEAAVTIIEQIEKENK